MSYVPFPVGVFDCVTRCDRVKKTIIRRDIGPINGVDSVAMDKKLACRSVLTQDGKSVFTIFCAQ